MYATNMSWNSAQKILTSLMEQAFLAIDETGGNGKRRRSYEITERGVNVLNHLKRMNEILSISG